MPTLPFREVSALAWPSSLRRQRGIVLWRLESRRRGDSVDEPCCFPQFAAVMLMTVAVEAIVISRAGAIALAPRSKSFMSFLSEVAGERGDQPC
jgi:hypothetical protein